MKIGLGDLRGLIGLGQCTDAFGDETSCDTTADPTAGAVPDCIWGGTYPNCASAPNVVSSTPVAAPSSTTIPTNASTTAGITALAQLTAAASSRLTALPGQTSLQPGQSLVVGPNGQYEIVSSGANVAGLSTAGLSSTSLLPILLIGAVALFAMESGGHR